MKPHKKIRIREVGPREGFQILSKVFPTEEKALLIDLLSESGLKEIEVTSFVRADKVPQMADAEELVHRIKKKHGIKYTGLYLNPEGFLRAEATKELDNEAWISAGCSDTFLKKNANTDLSRIINRLPDWLEAFNRKAKPLHGLMLSSAFGCAYEGEITHEHVVKVISKIISSLELLGSKLVEVCLADTVGLGSPQAIEKTVLEIKRNFPGLYISLHLHDTKGLGLANVRAGLELGVDCFDSSIGGIGGCPFTKGSPGNIATEDLVRLCESLNFETGIDIGKLREACYYLRDTLGIKLNSSMNTG